MYSYIDSSLTIALDPALSNVGSGNPKRALKPLLINLSPNRATTSFALAVTLGSWEDARFTVYDVGER